MKSVVKQSGEIAQIASTGQTVDPAYITMAVSDMTALAKGTDKFAKNVEKFGTTKFGQAGTVASVVSTFVESYNKIQENLQNISKNPIDMSVKLQNFADALAVDNDTFQVKNEALNFTVNVEVSLSADELDKAILDARKDRQNTSRTGTGDTKSKKAQDKKSNR